jgi:hypothetical protein
MDLVHTMGAPRGRSSLQTTSKGGDAVKDEDFPPTYFKKMKNNIIKKEKRKELCGSLSGPFFLQKLLNTTRITRSY